MSNTFRTFFLQCLRHDTNSTNHIEDFLCFFFVWKKEKYIGEGDLIHSKLVGKSYIWKFSFLSFLNPPMTKDLSWMLKIIYNIQIRIHACSKISGGENESINSCQMLKLINWFSSSSVTLLLKFLQILCIRAWNKSLRMPTYHRYDRNIAKQIVILLSFSFMAFVWKVNIFWICSVKNYRFVRHYYHVIKLFSFYQLES